MTTATRHARGWGADPDHGGPSSGTLDAVATVAPVGQRARRPVTARVREVFLEGLRDGWSVTRAAARAGTDRRRMYESAKADEGFRAEWQEALDAGSDLLEDELHRRAVEGWSEEVRGPDGELCERCRGGRRVRL